MSKVSEKQIKTSQQLELARLAWAMQEIKKDPELDEQRAYNQAMRGFYEQYVKIVGKPDTEGWNKFSLFVLGFSPSVESNLAGLGSAR